VIPSQTFTSITALRNYINANIIPNGQNKINGDENNNALNGLVDFIILSMVNGSKANIVSTGGVILLSKPVTIITSVTPTSIQWGNDFQNEYYIVNTLGVPITIASGFYYIDQTGTTQTSIPAKTAVHIAEGLNGSWFQINNAGGTGGGTSIVGLSATSLQFTVGSSVMTNGQTVLVINAANAINDSVWITLGGVEIPRNDNTQISYQVPDYSNPTQITITFNQQVATGQQYIVHYFQAQGTITPGNSTGGTATFSGNGTNTQFVIPHNLGVTPSVFTVNAASQDAIAFPFYVTSDSNNLYVNYSTAPALGVNNLIFSWFASI
jgi:hypothetical protein